MRKNSGSKEPAAPQRAATIVEGGGIVHIHGYVRGGGYVWMQQQ